MRILTWNLWGRNEPWQARRDAITATLADVEPDVCGLQEVWQADGHNLATDLAERLGMQCHFVMASLPDRAGGAVPIGNAVLSRWPIVERTQLRLPTGDSPDGRVVAHARIDAPGGALPVFTTHLTYRPGGSRIRLEQVRLLAEYVAGHTAADDAYPPVVTGDLNAEPDSDEIRLLGGVHTAPAAPGLVLLDAWRYADPADPGFTWDLRNPYQADSLIPSSRIDYVLVGLPRQGRGRVTSVRLAGTAPVDGVWPSDHFAVVADLARPR